MRLTDDVGLPLPLLEALRLSSGSEKIEPHDFRVSDLIESPRIRQLKRLHWPAIEEIASQQIWALFGSAIHDLIERHTRLSATPTYLPEQRLYSKIGSVVITGKIDLQVSGTNGKILTDYKYTSAFGAANHIKKWTEQLNCYAYLYHEEYGHDPEGLVIIAIYRDWSAYEARTQKNYPQKAIEKHMIPLWPFEARREFIEQRIELHLNAWAGAEMDQLPDCTDEERWIDHKFYVRSKSAVRNLKTCSSSEEAEAYIRAKGNKGLYILEATPTPRRCKGNWCHVAPFCSQYQNELQKQGNDAPHVNLDDLTLPDLLDAASPA